MEQIYNILNYEMMDIPLRVYLYSFLAALAGFIAKWLVTNFLAKLLEIAEKTKIKFNIILIKAITKPAGWACLIIGIYVAAKILPIPTEPVDLRRFIDALARGISALIVVWAASGLLDGIMDQWEEKAKRTETRLDNQLVPIVRSAGKTFLYIVGFVLILQNLGYSVTSLLAGLGLGGMAIALASKDTVANLFGSIVIFIDKPFQVGDWIEFGGVEGTVEEVGLRTTKIRTFANSLTTTPNAVFTNTSINNWSRMRKRRFVMTIGVTYSTPPDKIEKAVEGIRNIIKEDDNMETEFFMVNFDSFGAYSLNIFVYAFTRTIVWGEFLQARQEFMLEVMRLFQNLDIDFAFPTQTVHLEPPTGAYDPQLPQRPS